MATTETTGTLAKTTPKRNNTQQLAWGVMLVSFAFFCVIAISALLGVRYFLFQSRVPLLSSVEVSRGTPTLTQVGNEITSAITKPREIFNNSTLTTDTLSQAPVSFTDATTGQLIANVTVENGSSVHLQQGTRPRFDWVSDAYWIEFEEVYGIIDIFVPENLSRPVLLTFATTLGPSARFTSSGHFTLIAVGQRVQVVNYSGAALLGNQPVPSGHTGSVLGTGEDLQVALHVDQLGDAAFSENNFIDIDQTSVRVRPQAWICRNTVDYPDEPMGSVGLSVVDSRPALRLFRGEGADSHGETSCWHGLGPDMRGLNVASYSSVSLRATFMIRSQSLSTCGTVGSECPLTLAMDYIPINGDASNAIKWYQGFYAFLDPNRMFPFICDSCSEQHEQITPDVWYTYEIRNLFEKFAPASRPETILNLRFYASGHQYEVYVSQMVLLVDQQEEVVVTENSS